MLLLLPKEPAPPLRDRTFQFMRRRGETSFGAVSLWEAFLMPMGMVYCAWRGPGGRAVVVAPIPRTNREYRIARHDYWIQFVLAE